MRKQRGMGFGGIFLICALIVFGSVGAMKIVPSYLEYNTIKESILKVQASGASSVPDIKRAFEKQRDVNNIQSVTSNDLEISRDGSEVVISFAYPKKIHMFQNVYVCIDFAATTSAGGVAPPEKK